jgi:hypothetical protein
VPLRAAHDPRRLESELLAEVLTDDAAARAAIAEIQPS